MKTATIAKITAAYTRSYSDNGLVRSYVEWIDTDGKTGRTEGSPQNIHMNELFKRAIREGIKPTLQNW